MDGFEPALDHILNERLPIQYSKLRLFCEEERIWRPKQNKLKWWRLVSCVKVVLSQIDDTWREIAGKIEP